MQGPDFPNLEELLFASLQFPSSGADRTQQPTGHDI